MKAVDRSANVKRLVILGVVLLVVIVGAIWEFGFTLPGFQNALDELDVIAKNNMNRAQSREVVVKTIGGSPASTEYKKTELSTGEEDKTVRHQRIDRYKWNRLIPGKKSLEVLVTYDVVVSGEEIASFDPKNCPDSNWMFKAFYEPGNAPVSVSVKARKRPPLEQSLFQSLDDDVDGTLSESELTAGSLILKQMELFDPDGDKKISMEELKAAIAKMEEEKGRKLTNDEVYGFFGGMSPGEGVGGAGGASSGTGGMKKGSKRQGKGSDEKGTNGKSQKNRAEERKRTEGK